MSAAVWSVLIAALAFVVSVISLIWSHRVDSKQTEIQQRLLSIEEKRETARSKEALSAQVCAHIDRAEQNRAIVIENLGASHATELRILLDGKPLLDHDIIPSGQSEIEELGPHATVRYVMAIAMGAPSKVEIAIAWQDQSGSPGNWRSSLSIF